MSALEGRKLDHYRLIKQIGQGGMATVYLAEDTRAKERVALKVLSPTISGDRRFVRRFRREGGLVRQLKHPNIIPVTDYGEDQGLIYLAMPFINGETLHDIYVRGGATQEQAGRWLSQVAGALHFAHEQGVIHRDVKPSNVIVDQDDNALLVDFGLARWIEGSSTLTGSMLMGTPAYMSPEQARGDKLDARSDQYSLAVIIYQLYTGRLPFEGETPMQTAMKHLHQPVPRPSKANPELAPALERVLLTALAKDPQARFPSVRALNTAFQAALRGDPLTWLKPTRALEGDESPAHGIERASAPAETRGRPIWLLLLAGVLGLLLAAAGASFLLLGDGVEAVIPGGGEAAATASPAAAAAEASPSPSQPPPTENPAPSPVPPIASSECPGLRIYGFTVEGNDAFWLIDNGTARDLSLENLQDFSAPPSNQAVEAVRLGDELVFEGPAVEGMFTWIEGSERTIAAGEVERMTFTFAWQAAATDYAMELLLSGGCSLAGAW